MRRADGKEYDSTVLFARVVNGCHARRIFLHMRRRDVIENARVTVSVERFANAGLHGHFKYSHLVIFKQKLVILWSGGQSVVPGSPPLVEVSCSLSEQETGANSSDYQYNVRDSFHWLFPITGGRLQIVAFSLNKNARYTAPIRWCLMAPDIIPACTRLRLGSSLLEHPLMRTWSLTLWTRRSARSSGLQSPLSGNREPPLAE